MKVLQDTWISNGSSSKGSVLCEVNRKKVKMSYECGNAYDRFFIEVFDGVKFNTVADMADLGVQSDSSMYINRESEVFDKFNSLVREGKKYITNLLK